MPPPVVAADRLAKAYGGTVLFDDAAFQVQGGDRVALVGPNGAGKSTLLRILAGRERPDHGSLQAQPVRVHWFDQHPQTTPGATIGQTLAAERPVPPALAQEKGAIEARMADPAFYEARGFEAVLERYVEVEREIQMAAMPPDATGPLLGDLGFGEDDLARPVAPLSGGEKTRLFLARALLDARAGDLLVLDEPTNHLDIGSIEWLEDWLNAFSGTVMLVAHDRVFLDNVATRVFEVTQGRIRTFDGNYEDYVQARDEDLARSRRDHERAARRVQEARQVIQQFRKQKRFDGQYASRMKGLEKYEAALDRTPDPVLEKLGFALRFDAVQKSSDEVLHAQGLVHAFGPARILDGAELEVKKGERVGLVGGNGAGKTTLLRILLGRVHPDAGTVRMPPGVKAKFLGQEHDDLDPERLVIEEVLASRQGLDERDVKALLGRFRFDPEADLQRRVATLSGGERQRMMLLKCILEPSNLLVLDEPTNHLDLWARDVVVKALNTYRGTLLLVSHDRFLLDSVTDRTAVLDAGLVHTYPGSFTATRDLHLRRGGATTRARRYVVRKRFTDWTTQRRYRVHEEVELAESDFEASRTLRNARSYAWLEPAKA